MAKVLIVEDNPANRELLAEMLGSWGYELLEATDGQDALEKAASGQVDIVLLDIQMPVLDGYAVLSRLRANPDLAKLPVIALTAFAMRGDREKALACGFDAYLTKPIDFQQLRVELQKLSRPADTRPE